jgi:hypothetical protein
VAAWKKQAQSENARKGLTRNNSSGFWKPLESAALMRALTNLQLSIGRLCRRSKPPKLLATKQRALVVFAPGLAGTELQRGVRGLGVRPVPQPGNSVLGNQFPASQKSLAPARVHRGSQSSAKLLLMSCNNNSASCRWFRAIRGNKPRQARLDGHFTRLLTFGNKRRTSPV